jgi:signal transduction histidine kinase
MDFTAAIRPAKSVKNLSREAWVEMQLIQTFMRNAQPAHYATFIMIVVMVAMLYRHVAPAGLWLWAVAAVAVTLARTLVIKRYQPKLAGVSGPALHAFMARYAWLWPLSAMIWGSSMFLFFLTAPIYEHVVCLLILIGMGSFAISAFSANLRCFVGYINGLGLSVMAALAYQLGVEPGIHASFTTYGLVVLVLTYWVLIPSLTEKSRAALEAIAIKNRFIASAAHDLRQPVHALDLYAGWLVAEPQFVSQIAPKIVRSTKAVKDLFTSLFDLAGLDSDPLRVHLQEVDMARLVQDLEVQYAPVALERGLRFKTRAAPCQMRSDPVLLKRLVGNLLSNALRNTHRGGVLLALRRRRGVWCIEIWDTGMGIAQEHQQAIFQEFYRISRQGTEEGFGLGLAIVSRLSQALGHPIGMASRPGRGSVFWVELQSPAATAVP